MNQQIFVIHGGNAFATYDDYIAYLRSKEVDLESLDRKDWKSGLQEQLGSDYQVYRLSMPNSKNAKYLEWALWFEKYIPYMNDGVILVGHSLGAVFLAKYLSENTFPKHIRAVYMVAGPYNEDEGRTLPEFAITRPLVKVREQVKNLCIYHSKDDPVVAFSEMEKYQKELSTATFRVFEDRMHFNQEEFPEIVEDIKSL
jgi:uncharacterized protein